MKAIIRLELTYDLSDDATERRRIYGTEDPVECVNIDAQNDPVDLILLDGVVVEVADVGVKP